MKLLIQRVSEGSVKVEGEVIGKIGHGYVVLVGITHTDTKKEADWLANKLVGLRLFEDDDGKMNRSLQEVDGDLLLISQFTLYGDARKGRRPSFTNASRPEHAEPLFDYFVNQLRLQVTNVATGKFGADMKVSLINDGPVTLMLERDADK